MVFRCYILFTTYYSEISCLRSLSSPITLLWTIYTQRFRLHRWEKIARDDEPVRRPGRTLFEETSSTSSQSTDAQHASATAASSSGLSAAKKRHAQLPEIKTEPVEIEEIYASPSLNSRPAQQTDSYFEIFSCWSTHSPTTSIPTPPLPKRIPPRGSTFHPSHTFHQQNSSHPAPVSRSASNPDPSATLRGVPPPPRGVPPLASDSVRTTSSNGAPPRGVPPPAHLSNDVASGTGLPFAETTPGSAGGYGMSDH
ncbi:hypothetical protein PENTCL1PPCAC_13412 [Pristionchus entomophagus]|uniref:G protein-coupled receptor n=1 Tax=Pristionchus entomophagus TaxID=358040 RepID=A0AAV5T8J1_9BILA|nr:hypothetical protein PENTCL1PPCAC_13412 [Pristionchus entomophagus]